MSGVVTPAAAPAQKPVTAVCWWGVWFGTQRVPNQTNRAAQG
ncbi:MAG TPA: hypothetical protein VGL08_06460 [Paraburkholderia sp.]